MAEYEHIQNLATLGKAAVATSAKVTDPDAATATIIGLLRGILEELQAQTVLLTSIETNTEPV